MRNIVETRLSATVERWPFQKPFRITGYEWTESEVLVVEARVGDLVGRGESLGVYYLNDTPERAKAQIEALASPFDAAQLPAGGARNALDCALWDLRAKIERKPVWQLLGLEAPQPLRTTYTVGADEPAAMAATARGYTNARALKLKLTGDGDAERVLAVRAARHDVWLGVDANQGFTRESLERLLPVLEECDVQLIEQPFPVGCESRSRRPCIRDSDRRRRKRPGLVGPQKPRRAFRRGEHQVGQVRRPYRRHRDA